MTKNRKILLFAIAAVTLLWLGRFLFRLWSHETTDDAYVAGHVHQVSPEIGGEVTAVTARENQTVKAGDILARIDPLEEEIGVEKAKAGLAQAQAAQALARAAAAQARSKVAEARARIGQAEAQGKQAQAQRELARQTLDRDRRMSASGPDSAVTPAEMDAATASFHNADAAVNASSANLEAMRAAVVSAETDQAAAAAQSLAADASVAAGQAGIRDAQRQLSYVTLRSPANGRVAAKSVEVGNRVQVGQTLMVVVEPEVWIEANFKETQLARLAAGLAAEVTLDALPGRIFHAKIDSVSPASGAEFALLPADNATGNFTKVVQRVPVKIVFDPAEIESVADRIRPGLSATVSVQIR